MPHAMRYLLQFGRIWIGRYQLKFRFDKPKIPHHVRYDIYFLDFWIWMFFYAIVICEDLADSKSSLE